MSLSDLPDVALINIFQTLDHVELIHVYDSFHLSSKRIQNLISNCSCLWTNIHIKSTFDYHLFTQFISLLMLNVHTIRYLTIDQLDIQCRKILYEGGFSLKKLINIEQLIIYDDYICNSIQSLQYFCSTLKILHLKNDHMNLKTINNINQLNSLEIILHSIDLIDNHFEYLTNLNLKIMFDYDHHSQKVFSSLPYKSIHVLKLKFLLLNNDWNFRNQFHRYLNSCSYLHTIELFYLHSMCPLSLYTNINYSKYKRIIFSNICQLKVMKEFIEFNQYKLPYEYLQINTTINQNRYSSYIKNDYWFTQKLISIDYLECVTTSIELFNEIDMVWSDKNQMTQSFESYILRSIYNVPYLICSLRNLSISKFEMSAHGLITLLTSFPCLFDLVITDGICDQMGSAMSDIGNIMNSIGDLNQSVLKTITMTNIQMSRRTIIHFCLITQQLTTLTLNNVQIFDRTIPIEQNKHNIQLNFLYLLKQISQHTRQFQWNNLKSLSLGKSMIISNSIRSFIPSNLVHHYMTNINHLRFVIDDPCFVQSNDLFLKLIKRFMKISLKLSSFIIEFTKPYNDLHILRSQLYRIFQMNINKKVYVYSNTNDRTCRFCFGNYFTNNNDNDEIGMSKCNRTFCGIPLFQIRRKQRESDSFS